MFIGVHKTIPILRALERNQLHDRRGDVSLIQTIRKLIVTGLLLYVVVGPPSADANEPIKIAAIFPKTGDAIFNLEEDPHFRAVAFAVEELNQKGGLLGRPLVVSEYDNQSSGIGAKNMGLDWLGVTPAFSDPNVQMVQPRRTNLQNNFVVGELGFGDFFDPDHIGSPVLSDCCCFHSNNPDK